MKFAVIGGDQRLVRLCALLAADGHGVRAFGMERASSPPGILMSLSAGEAANGADCVILPLPVVVKRGYLNTPLSAGEYDIEDIFSSISPDSLVCAGRVDEATERKAKEHNLRLTDYFQREELVVRNAVATAEGALGIIMQETATTVHGSKILVIGYGRTGKLLAHRLRGMGAFVTVSARKFSDKAWIEAMGYISADTDTLTGTLTGPLDEYDVIVNTVPAPVLDEAHLTGLKPDALCLDLASKPGGIDFAAASQLGVRVIWALSLPGEVAPETAGEIIRDTIYNILIEQGELL